MPNHETPTAATLHEAAMRAMYPPPNKRRGRPATPRQAAFSAGPLHVHAEGRGAPQRATLRMTGPRK